MVENKTRGEQLFEEVKGSGSSSSLESPSKGMMAGVMRGVRALFLRTGLNSGGAPTKTPTSVLPAAFIARKLDLKSINQTLAFILVGLIALIGYFAFGERQDISSVTAAVSKIKFPDLEDKEITPFQEPAFYLDQIKKRDIFNEFKVPKPPPPIVEPKKPLPPPPPPKVTIQEKAKDLKIMGISWGNDPKVIIKNESTQEVHFMEEGQKIKGTDIHVKKILKDEILISSEDEEMKML